MIVVPMLTAITQRHRTIYLCSSSSSAAVPSVFWSPEHKRQCSVAPYMPLCAQLCMLALCVRACSSVLADMSPRFSIVVQLLPNNVCGLVSRCVLMGESNLVVLFHIWAWMSVCEAGGWVASQGTKAVEAT